MTKEEYVSTLKEIKEQESALYWKEKRIYGEYREEHREFKDGDKVLITYKDFMNKTLQTSAFVSSCNVHEDGTLFYAFRKLKQDGSMSNHRFREFEEILTIELLEPAKQ